jgi:hypothetical protein
MLASSLACLDKLCDAVRSLARWQSRELRAERAYRDGKSWLIAKDRCIASKEFLPMNWFIGPERSIFDELVHRSRYTCVSHNLYAHQTGFNIWGDLKVLSTLVTAFQRD